MAEQHSTRNPKPPCTCLFCGREYINKRRGKAEGHKYCGRDCSAKGQAVERAERARPKYCKVHVSQCKACSKYISSKLPRLYCDDVCRRAAYSTAPSTKECKCCGDTFIPEYTGGSLTDYCGDVCRDKAKASHKRTHRARRKAVIRGATIERVDPYMVFDRDRWRCRLCGIRTPKTKRGTYSDNAPELDHINPLSQGGEHSYINTQCTCRKCNLVKSSKPLGQTLMFG